RWLEPRIHFVLEIRRRMHLKAVVTARERIAEAVDETLLGLSIRMVLAGEDHDLLAIADDRVRLLVRLHARRNAARREQRDGQQRQQRPCRARASLNRRARRTSQLHFVSPAASSSRPAALQTWSRSSRRPRASRRSRRDAPNPLAGA